MGALSKTGIVTENRNSIRAESKNCIRVKRASRRKLTSAPNETRPQDFLEIYNERVHDLLVGGSEEGRDCSSLPRRRGNARKDLRVREHPTRGPYVQNLRRVVVRDCESLLNLVREGARRRRTAATRRNPVSSRSHALLELVTPQATLHLADLAGSTGGKHDFPIHDEGEEDNTERVGMSCFPPVMSTHFSFTQMECSRYPEGNEKASWEGCGGGRQKEGANINKSLVALSNVISALGE
ncbi:Kinesin-like protein unc-104 [Eumeta japonica]|uniref:Kinesin-like protein unc-104 n=1 Tax=Eumeta variegata TaxID=151549 RepID=A0A4C1ZY42_EUMVA|nr:Kinesin-like protein unc-104 [Eumeta japonica]